MIEKYIEKDIIRQVKVVEYLFELKKVNIQDIANFLGVSRITIKRDIDIILLLEPRIHVVLKNSSSVKVMFWPEATRYDIVKKIYKQSNFLALCSFYLKGETNYITIAEKENISVAKTFYLRKQVIEFFIDAGVMDQSKNFIDNEFKMRLIILTIWMRIDIFDDWIDKRMLYQAQVIAKRFIETFSNSLNKREIHFLELVIYLSFKRQSKNLIILERDFKYIHQGFLYNEVEKILSDFNFNINEMTFITMMYRLLNQNLDDYQYLTIEHKHLRKTFIDNMPKVIQLVHIFEAKFNRELLKDIMFEKPLIRYIISTFLDHQMFLVEKHYFLNLRQRELYQEIEQIMLNWIEYYGFNVQISTPSTEKFCLQISELLLNDSNKKWNVFVVAEDEFSHLAYREWIERRLNTERITLNTTLYYNLESLPVYIDTDSSIIICERILIDCTDCEELSKIKAKLFPVSLVSITDDLQVFFDFVFNQ
ncbi:helix-turn-helix domain-containing protein [Enterococcus hirae]|uniref:helix-turn-helix domain-containing protein n=1 Tax=Enterococcus hirae TaxID=1354 RepID=UPI001378255F|nr:helix-turn-helix domain-containing protein [Enterococcus hirae]NBA40607.1 DeoR family transcriptional regulator [Enterococcus hirae]NBA56545.1 DeoR family transcriptional regulator [Enterococcus hirae]